jgi:hypothetical protein
LSKQLDGLIANLEASAAPERIALRDPILGFGAASIEPLLGAAQRTPGVSASVAAWLGELMQRDSDARPQARQALRSMLAGPAGSIAKEILDRLDGSTTKKATGSLQLHDPFAVDGLPEGAGVGWPGFQPHEFEGIAGTMWRQKDGRTSLAPILVRALRYRHPHVMSYGVQRSPELHLALTDRYRLGDEPESGWRAAKLIVYAHGPTETDPTANREVVAGLYVEKGSEADAKRFGIMDDRSWDWPWLIRALRDEHASDELARAMVRHDLRIGDYIGGRIRSESDRVGFIASMEAGDLVIRPRDGSAIETGFDRVADRLEAQPAAEWRSIHVWRTWSADEAINQGPAFATNALLPVLGDLFDVYLDVVNPVL